MAASTSTAAMAALNKPKSIGPSLKTTLLTCVKLMYEQSNMRKDGKGAMCRDKGEQLTQHETLLSYLARYSIETTHPGSSNMLPIEAILRQLKTPYQEAIFSLFRQQWDEYKAFVYSHSWKMLIATVDILPNKFKDDIACLTFDSLFNEDINPYWNNVPMAERKPSRFPLLVPAYMSIIGTTTDPFPLSIPSTAFWKHQVVVPSSSLGNDVEWEGMKEYIEQWISLQKHRGAMALYQYVLANVIQPSLVLYASDIKQTIKTMTLAWPNGIITTSSLESDTKEIKGEDGPVIETHHSAFLKWIQHGLDPLTQLHVRVVSILKQLTSIVNSAYSGVGVVEPVITAVKIGMASAKKTTTESSNLLSASDTLMHNLQVAYEHYSEWKLSEAEYNGLELAQQHLADSLTTDIRRAYLLGTCIDPLINLHDATMQARNRFTAIVKKHEDYINEYSSVWSTDYNTMAAAAINYDAMVFYHGLLDTVLAIIEKTLLDLARMTDKKQRLVHEKNALLMIYNTLNAKTKEIEEDTNNSKIEHVAIDELQRRILTHCSNIDIDTQDTRAKYYTSPTKLQSLRDNAISASQERCESQAAQTRTWEHAINNKYLSTWSNEVLRIKSLETFKFFCDDLNKQLKLFPATLGMPTVMLWKQAIEEMSMIGEPEADAITPMSNPNGGVTFGVFLDRIAPVFQSCLTYEACHVRPPFTESPSSPTFASAATSGGVSRKRK